MQDDNSDTTDIPVSKSQRKREMHELQDLGERLVALSEGQLTTLALPESLQLAVHDARNMSRREARRRQMQYIGKLMRNIDAEPIRAKLDEWDGQSRGSAVELHQLERWRERLISEEGALGEYITQHQQFGVDTQRLRTLIRNVREERERSKPPRAFRELFQELKRIADTPGDQEHP